MANERTGSIHLGRLAGVDLYLHWSWFVVAAIEISYRRGSYSSVIWNVLEYLALFLIVLTHEFGHALACRQVGGVANRILLWPFGGVAFVDPPQRPGATLWSIAAGPLVNVALIPLLSVAVMLARAHGWRLEMPDAYKFLISVWWTNLVLLAFNILPVYPLDGGQILRSLLWFVLGRGRSLLVATALGFVGIAGLLAAAIWMQSLWTGLISLYLGVSCWASFKSARAMVLREKMARRPGFACPRCGMAPPMAPVWRCDRCTETFDPFATGSACPNCGVTHENTMCVDCHQMSPLHAWEAAGSCVGPGVMSSSFETK